jgi:inner membrane protein
MASLGHIAVGMAATRVYGTESSTRRSWLKAAVLWSLLSMLPDADVIGFSFGVRYEDEWGHRGATHSLAFSFALGAAIGLAAPLFRLPAVRTGIAAGLVLASHALLDTLTNGGLGCALLWPFDLTRYFAPWNPIPVAPIGLYFFSPYGLTVATVELLLFAPLLWFGLSSPPVARTPLDARRTSVRALLVGVWLIAVWLLTSGDSVRDRVVGFALRDDTEFTRDFSELLLRTVKNGHTEQEVHGRLGLPFYELLVYSDLPDVCVAVRIERDAVMSARPSEVCRQRGIEPAVSRATVLQALGGPAEVCWMYSRSPAGRYYRARAVCFANDRVTGLFRGWYRD